MAGPQLLIRKRPDASVTPSSPTPQPAQTTPPEAESSPSAPAAAVAPAPAATTAAAVSVPTTSAVPAVSKTSAPPAKAESKATAETQPGKKLVDLGNGKFVALQDAIDGENAIVRTLRSEEAKSGIVAAMGGNGDPSKFIDSAVAYVSDRSDTVSWARLALCTPSSVVESIKDLAAVGLAVNAVKGTAFLTPRNSNGVFVATSVPGVRGLEERICSSPQIASIEANAIRAMDTFECDEGNAKHLVFKRKLGIVDPEKNPIIGAYSVVRAKDGRIHISTTSIFQKTDEATVLGRKVKQFKFLRQDGSELNVSRMPAEVAAAYYAQRKAMREVGRTWLHEDASTQALIQLEDRSNRDLAAEASEPSQKEEAAAKNAPQVRDAAPLKTAEVSTGENQEPVRTGTSVGV